MTSCISLGWGILHSSSRLFFFPFFADISLLLQAYKNRNTFFFPLKWCWPQFFSSLGCKIIKSACKEGNVYKAMILMSDAIFNPNIYASPSNLCLLTSAEFSGLTFIGVSFMKLSVVFQNNIQGSFPKGSLTIVTHTDWFLYMQEKTWLIRLN